MEANLQRRVQQYGWDRAADYYENSWQAQLQPAHDLLLQMADIKTGENVLDIAAGTGLVTFLMAKQLGDSGYVLGTDISEAMVEKATEEAKIRGIANVEFKRMGAEALEVEKEMFDVSVCALGLMYVPEVDIALKEMYRTLQPGGRAVTAVWGSRRNCGWADIFPIVDARVSSDVCPLFFQLGTGEVLKQSMERAGFMDVWVKRISTVLKYENDNIACEAAFLGGPVALAYSRFDEEVKKAAREEYLDSIDEYRTGLEYAIPGEFVVAVGHK